MVADALELIRDVVECQQQAQVARNRRLCRDGQLDQRRDVALCLVDPGVADYYRRGRVGIVRDERGQCRLDLCSYQAAHPQNLVLDLAFRPVQSLARGVNERGGLRVAEVLAAQV